jgi:lipoprotein-releasing system ATP-binding protein
MNKKPVILQGNNLHKTYHDGHHDVEVLKGVDFSLHQNETIAICGSSGSGKSTLLHILGGLDAPTEGNVMLHKDELSTASENKRALLRNQHLGFVFQFHHLLPEFSALENVAMPLLLRGDSNKSSFAQARDILVKVGLEKRLSHRSAALSGGERQRVAIARALVHQPDALLADEPTGNLDQDNALKVFDLMQEMQESLGLALVLVTHDNVLAGNMQRQLKIENGKIV